MPQPIDRRRLLATLAALPAAALTRPLVAQAQEAGLITGAVCSLQAETTEGPYYIDPDLIRSDITEARSGTPLTLRLQVVTADCRPIRNARVDVWHCDADGAYSGVSSRTGDFSGQTFLRGTQFSDAQGITTFQSIYPGWYPGRTPHIHYKVFLDQRTALTSQIFFPDATNDTVYASGGAYRNGPADRSNAHDGIARRAGDAAIAAVSGTPDRMAADLVVGVAA